MQKNGLSLTAIGPGIVIAATGLGAGDLITAAVAGANFGTTLLWAVLLGAILKYVLNEGLARWQLVTDITLLEGWVKYLPLALSWYFLLYLVLWSFIVAGALMAACGLAAHAMIPALSVTQWGIVHAVAAVLLVWLGRYRLLEPMMKGFTLLMFVVVLYCAFSVAPPWQDIANSLLRPGMPDGSLVFILGVMGGVGGSVTLLSYGYWIRERRWSDREHLPQIRLDLGVAYAVTGLFGIAIMIVAAGVAPEVVKGPRMALVLADHLETSMGPVGKWCFLAGFWGAVFSSMLGVWQGVPYLFCDFVQQLQHRQQDIPPDRISTQSPLYRGYLLYLAFPPMLLLLVGKPVWLVIAYAVAGSFFMPVLAGVLLYMNNRAKWLGDLRNRLTTNLGLLVALLLFGALAVTQLIKQFEG